MCRMGAGWMVTYYQQQGAQSMDKKTADRSPRSTKDGKKNGFFGKFKKKKPVPGLYPWQAYQNLIEMLNLSLLLKMI